MPSGFEAYRDNGSLQFSSLYSQYTLTQKLNMNTVSYASVGAAAATSSILMVPINDVARESIVAIYTAAAITRGGTAFYNGAWYTMFYSGGAVGTACTVYIFDRVNIASPINVGFEAYREDGQRSFHSALPPIKVAGVVGGINNTFTYDSGRTYAAVMSAPAGKGITDYGTVRRFNQENPQDKYYYFDVNYDNKLYGFRNVNNYQIQLAAISYYSSTGEYRTTASGQPPPDSVNYDRDISGVMIVDVTGL